MKRSHLVLAMASIMLVATPQAQATIIQYSATLNGSSESPPNASPGTGYALITIDDLLNTLRVEVSFSGLLGTTTSAHIHCCTAAALTGTAGVATSTPTFLGFPSGVTSGTYDNLFDMTDSTSYNPSFITSNGGSAASAKAVLFAGIAADKAYFNIHTTSFGGGEIRGFLQQVPEPATLTLFGLGLAGLGLSRRKQAYMQPCNTRLGVRGHFWI